MYLLACLYSYAKSRLISILTNILLTKLARMALHQHFLTRNSLEYSPERRIGPSNIVYSNKFDRFMCDLDIKQFLEKEIGMTSFREIAREDKQMLCKNFPGQKLPEWNSIRHESY